MRGMFDVRCTIVAEIFSSANMSFSEEVILSLAPDLPG